MVAFPPGPDKGPRIAEAVGKGTSRMGWRGNLFIPPLHAMNNAKDPSTDPLLTEDFLRRYDVPGPRYTSYPPAPHFRPDLEPRRVEQLLVDSNSVGTRALSFYVHVPFCPKQCLFCGCTTEIGRPGSQVNEYFRVLALEMERVLPLLDASRPVTQVHFGGGTPNGVPYRHLREVLDRLRGRFRFDPDAEVAIECDPNLLTERKLGELRDMGFNRVSFGLQDFDLGVLEAVNRGFPRLAPSELVRISHGLGFRGVNLDLIYGLPRQTPESFAASVEQCIAARPDRVATFSYAHVPWAKEHQLALEAKGLPSPESKLRMAVETHNAFLQAGYRAIGMDHFALPDDDLAIALEEGRLHRNFQGYCSRRTTGQVVGFGASAISQLHQGYVQNVKESLSWQSAVESGALPFERAYVLDQEESFRRDVINSLMCDGVLDPSSPALAGDFSLSQVRERLAPGLSRLDPFLEDGLVERDGEVVRVTAKGRLVVRNVAMLFDPLVDSGTARYSRTV